MGAKIGRTRREFLAHALGAASALAAGSGLLPRSAVAEESAPGGSQPNFIIIFTDDQGYNDVGCFGSPLIKTPRLDRMAAEGMRFTDFHVSAPVCTPSRASLMTGCYAQRVGLGAIPNRSGTLDNPNVVLPTDLPYGLHPDEVTIADLLKGRGYVTACVGKWHLGHEDEFLPTRQGFDSYFGIPYSNDMKPTCMMRNEEIVEETVVQETLTERYTEEAVRFIEDNSARPFFLYLAHNMPHTPLHVSEKFKDKSAGGLYGDVIECIDWSVGRILDTLEKAGIDGNTLVVFTSDNGPWLCKGEHGGFATPLRAGKGTTYEGGMRVPCIMRWPGHIPAAATCSELATTMDVLPTFVKLAGGEVPTDRIIDGKNIQSLMMGEPGAVSPYEAFYHYFAGELHAVRSGSWKLKLETSLYNEDIYRPGYRRHDVRIPPSLYNLSTDPGEQRNLLDAHPDIVKRMEALADRAREDLGDTLTGAVGKNLRPIGKARNPKRSIVVPAQ